MLDKPKMLEQSIARMNELKVGIRSMTQAVETLSVRQCQCVAVARAAAFAHHVARLGKRGAVLNLKKISISDAEAVMTGALLPDKLPEECLA